MAGNNLSPRQKMIGMMYLVLTALLALNTSKEIINAFVTINESLESSVGNMVSKNGLAYTTFEKQMVNDKTKTEPYYKRAQQVKKLASDLDKYINALKDELIRETDKIEKGAKTRTLREVEAKDNYDVPTHMLCGDKQDGRGFKASALKQSIDKFKKDVIADLEAKDQAEFTNRLNQLFNTKDPDPKNANDKLLIEEGKRSWEMANFYHNPVVASVAQLTKFQLDLKNAESEIVNHLLSSIDATNLKFSDVMPKVVAPTSYVIIGQQYEADVFLAAYSKTSAPEIVVGGQTLPVEDGMGKYRASPRTPGEQKWGGMIRVKQPDNTYKEYPFESSFIASAPSASVSADKMNVIYIGVDNPISISVPGVPAEKVSFNAKGVTLTPDPKGGKGHFTAKATAPGIATIDVVAAQGDKKIPMGSFSFRLKRIPDPVAKIGGKRDGSMPKAQLAAQSAIIPVMEGFDFDLFSKVKSFKMSRYGKGRDPVEKSSETNVLTGDMSEIIKQSRPGDKILFEYIKATMPDGTTRDINSISITVQ